MELKKLKIFILATFIRFPQIFRPSPSHAEEQKNVEMALRSYCETGENRSKRPFYPLLVCKKNLWWFLDIMEKSLIMRTYIQTIIVSNQLREMRILKRLYGAMDVCFILQKQFFFLYFLTSIYYFYLYFSRSQRKI